LRDVGAEVVAALGSDPGLLRWGALPYRPADQMRYVFDVRRAAERLGFRARTSLPDGIRRTVRAT
jgi:nucleoside-diphosphate-sugar epimerase